MTESLDERERGIQDRKEERQNSDEVMFESKQQLRAN